MTCDRLGCRSGSPVVRGVCPLCRKIYLRCIDCGGVAGLGRSIRQHTVMLHRQEPEARK